MPVVENECPEGNAEGLKILRESLKKVQITASSPTDATHVFVVFGASGDLAKKKIYPTLWALFRDGLMPPGTQIFGYARSKMTVAQLRERCVGTVKAREGEEAALESFWASNNYVAGSYDTQRDFEILNQVRKLELSSLQGNHDDVLQEMASVEKGHANRLFYLALPPSVFKPVTSMLKVSTIYTRVFAAPGPACLMIVPGAHHISSHLIDKLQHNGQGR